VCEQKLKSLSLCLWDQDKQKPIKLKGGINPLTRLETAAWRDFQEFWKNISKIWQMYKRCGESVLEADLEEGDEKFKPLFTNSKKDDNLFEENVRKYWRENYHFIVGSYEELVKIFSNFRKRNNSQDSLILLPETVDYGGKRETGQDQTYSIEKRFYDGIKCQARLTNNSSKLILINKKEEKVLTILVSWRPKYHHEEIIVSERKEKDVIIA